MKRIDAASPQSITRTPQPAEIRPPQAAPQQGMRATPAAENPFVSLLNRAEQGWRATEQGSIKQLKGLPAQMRSAMEAQVSMHRLAYTTELITRTADGFSSAMKRIQQMGS